MKRVCAGWPEPARTLRSEPVLRDRSQGQVNPALAALQAPGQQGDIGLPDLTLAKGLVQGVQDAGFPGQQQAAAGAPVQPMRQLQKTLAGAGGA